MPAARIYWLTTEFFPPETGGTGMIASRLAQGLGERGFGVSVITRQTLPRCTPRETVGHLEVRRLEPAGRMKGAGWRALPAMLAFISRLALILIAERRRYDVVVVSGMKIIPLAAVPICRLLRKRCIVRVESPFELVEPVSAESLDLMNGAAGRALSRSLKWMQRWVLRRASGVIAISKDIAERLEEAGLPAERIACIPNAVDLATFKPVGPEERERLRERLGFDRDTTVVLYVGRLSRAKGVMRLLQAWSHVGRRHAKARLVMVGSGLGSWDDCEAEMAAFLKAEQLEAEVAMVGHSEAVHEFLQAADLFVSPSDYEGFSLTLVEALGCGIPVVTTAVGAAPEFVRTGRNGYLCEPKDLKSLQDALDLALSERGRWPSVGSEARITAEPFGIAQVVDRYVRLLGEGSANEARTPGNSPR